MTEPTDPRTKIELLKKQPVFSAFTEKEIDELAQLLVEKFFEQGQTVVIEGEPVDSVYFIVDGIADVREVRIYDGKEVIKSLAKLYPGDSIGLNESGFYSLSGVRTATVVAGTPLLLLHLSVAAFHGFMLTHQHVNEVMRKKAEDLLQNEKI